MSNQHPDNCADDSIYDGLHSLPPFYLFAREFAVFRLGMTIKEERQRKERASTNNAEREREKKVGIERAPTLFLRAPLPRPFPSPIPNTCGREGGGEGGTARKKKRRCFLSIRSTFLYPRHIVPDGEDTTGTGMGMGMGNGADKTGTGGGGCEVTG